MMMFADLHKLSAVEMLDALRKAEWTAVDLMEACFSRIDLVGQDIRAFAFLNREESIFQAKVADALMESGLPLPPLHGLPIAVKDIIDTEDMPTEYGTPIHKGRQPKRDATIVARLKAAGAIIVGKAVTSEYAVVVAGPTRNPHDLDRTPGGSSSGSAAAVASFMVPLALSTQTNGSTIRPASFCGVVGYKPSLGILPRGGILKHAFLLDHPGVMARTVADVALLVEAIGGEDLSDEQSFGASAAGFTAAAAQRGTTDFISAALDGHALPSLSPLVGESRRGGPRRGHSHPRQGFPGGELGPPPNPPPQGETAKQEPSGLSSAEPRFAFIRGPSWSLADSFTKNRIETFVAKVDADIDMIELPPLFDRAAETLQLIMCAGIAQDLAENPANAGHRMADVLMRIIERGRAISATALLDAFALRDEIRRAFDAIIAPYDAALTPAARGIAPLVVDGTGDPIFATLWTLIGVPAISLPLLEGEHGLPLGIQLVAGTRQDRRLLAASAWLEAAAARK